jgi:plastocyanin
MHKIFRGFSIVAACLLLVWMIGCKSNSSSPTAPSTSTPPAANTVAMAGNTFSPSSLTVPVHTTIAWNNNSSITHTSTSDVGIWNTGNIPAGSTAHTTFDSLGAFHYHCAIHPGMTGIITVQ